MKNTKDKMGHVWKPRGTNVCPHICTECGELSGTKEAGDKCFVRTKPTGVNGIRKRDPKSVTKEVGRPVSKKEIDEVLRELATERVLGRRAVACIPNVEEYGLEGEVIVMSEDDLDNYSTAVVFADFGDYAFKSKKGEDYIKGMRVVIDDSFEYPVVYVKGKVPKKYRVKSKKV
jgi:hypothetical protein